MVTRRLILGLIGWRCGCKQKTSGSFRTSQVIFDFFSLAHLLIIPLDCHPFDIVEPKHPCAGSLTIDDVQRRIAQQVQELHLDERFAVGKEMVGRHLAAGQKKATSAFNKIWADMEALREAQRKKNEESKASAAAGGSATTSSIEKSVGKFPRAPDFATVGATVSAAGSKTGAYLSSWASWTGEKRRTGWGRATPKDVSIAPSSPTMSSTSRLSTNASTGIISTKEQDFPSADARMNGIGVDETDNHVKKSS